MYLLFLFLFDYFFLFLFGTFEHNFNLECNKILNVKFINITQTY